MHDMPYVTAPRMYAFKSRRSREQGRRAGLNPQATPARPPVILSRLLALQNRNGTHEHARHGEPTRSQQDTPSHAPVLDFGACTENS